MNNYYRIILCAFILLFIPISFNHFIKAEENEPSFINSFENDITGDGFHEYIKLQGRLLTNDSSFYQDVWIDITSSFKRDWSISLQNGYDPEVQLIDLNHNNIFDLFYKVAKDEDKSNFHYQLYSLKSGKVEKLPLPKHLHIQGEFSDNFKVNIELHPTKKPITLDFSPKKDFYINANLYDENGNVQYKKNVVINPFSSLTPTIISKSKGYGLKSVQTIKGVDNDVIGTIETLWYFQKNKWINIKTDVIQFKQ